MKFIFSKRTAAAMIILLVVVAAIFFLFVLRNKIKPVIIEEPKTNAVKQIVLGLSVEGREIVAYDYGSGPNRIAFLGGIHGGYEWNSVLLAYKLMDYLTANPEIIPPNLTVTVIPVVNPDGLYKVIGKEGKFTAFDVPASLPNGTGRFNSNNVDLNRNFDCQWQATSTWQNKSVSAGTAVFSEPEAKAIKNFVFKNNPVAMIFFHSQSNAVYASQCGGDVLPQTLNIMNAYSKASGYPAVKTFTAYVTTGAAEDWLASINVPAITVELSTHESVEWDRNLLGVKALLEYFNK